MSDKYDGTIDRFYLTEAGRKWLVEKHEKTLLEKIPQVQKEVALQDEGRCNGELSMLEKLSRPPEGVCRECGGNGLVVTNEQAKEIQESYEGSSRPTPDLQCPACNGTGKYADDVDDGTSLLPVP